MKLSTDSELEISHLQYADDTVQFCKANAETILRAIFILFGKLLLVYILSGTKAIFI